MRSKILALLLLSPAFAAMGQVTFTNQERTISAQMPSGNPASASASGFAPFMQSVSSTGFGATATASQYSTLDPMVISASGSAYEGQGYIFGNPVGGSASSNFAVWFTLPYSQTFTISGSFDRAMCHLLGPGVDIWLSTPNASASGTFLAGGTYSLVVGTSGGYENGQPQTGSYNLQCSMTGIVNEPIGTSFTYQGVVRKDGAPVSSLCDFEFALFERSWGTSQIGPTLQAHAIPVINGMFTQKLDFGPVFDADEKWLEIRVRNPAGSGAFETLSPRIRLDPVPNAIFATDAAHVPWTGVRDVPENVSNAFSPWQPTTGGIFYSGGQVVIPTEATSGISFGAPGDLGAGAENTDFIGFRRVNPFSGTPNQSELRLFLGDELSGQSTDYFTIGTAPNGTWTPRIQFGSDGTARKPGGGSWAALSDPRAKHDAKPLHGTLDRVLQLRGYQYFYNDSEIENGRALPGLQIGLMADEVEKVFPDWVARDHDGMRMVTERATTALMVEALRDLRSEKDLQIAERDSRIQNLEADNREMKARLDRLERALQPAAR